MCHRLEKCAFKYEDERELESIEFVIFDNDLRAHFICTIHYNNMEHFKIPPLRE